MRRDIERETRYLFCTSALRRRRPFTWGGSIDPLAHEVRAASRAVPNSGIERGMPEITNKSEEQKVAEAEVESFRKDLGPFVVAAETTRMAMGVHGRKGTGSSDHFCQ
jgi:hypothetical protein